MKRHGKEPNELKRPVSASSYRQLSSPRVEQNPWSEDIQSSGGLHYALKLAQASGIVEETPQDIKERILREAYATMPSLQLSQLMDEVIRVTDEVHQEKEKIKLYQLQKEIQDICRYDVMEKRTETLNMWNEHLKQVLEQKSQILGRLQKPRVGNSIPVEAKYKRHVSEMVSMLVPTLSDLSSTLDDIEWFSTCREVNQEVEPVLDEITNLLASLHCRFESSWKMNEAFRAYCEAKKNNLQ